MPNPLRLPPLALLLIVSAPFLFVKLGMPFLDPDEGLYATIALEMVRGGDWVLPHANGLPYLEKPPLYFWRARAGGEALGRLDEAVLRLPAVLAGVA